MYLSILFRPCRPPAAAKTTIQTLSPLPPLPPPLLKMGGIDTDVSDSEDSDSNGEALSPLAPGRLSCHWSSPAQLAGFDKQTAGKSTACTESLSPQDLWNRDGDDSYFGVGVCDDRSLGSRGARPLVWDYLPGETSITLGVRLYLTHLDPFVSHEENCARLLRQASAYRTVPYLTMHDRTIPYFIRYHTTRSSPCF